MRVKDIILKNKGVAFLAFIAKVVEAILELLVPVVMATLINMGINQNDQSVIRRQGMLLVVLPLLGYFAALICQYLASKVAQDIGTEVRLEMFKTLNHMDRKQLDKITASSVVVRIENDTQNLQLAIALMIRLGSRVPVLLIGSIVMAFYVSPALAPIFIIGGLIIGVILVYINMFTNKQNGQIQRRMDQLSRIVRENFSGIRDIRAFANEKHEVDRFEKQNIILRAEQLTMGGVQALANPSSLLLVNLAIAFILFFGGRLVNNGQFMQGDVVALIQYMNNILLALNVLVNILLVFSRGVAGIHRIDEVLEIKPEILSGDKQILDHTPLAIHFDNVSFAYGERNTIEDINADIQPGSFFGIIGGTASGKSTLVNLLLRNDDVNQGKIMINNMLIQDLDLRNYRQKIGLVPQSASLFTGTLRENLLMGKQDITDQDLWQALEIAQAKEFVEQNTLGLDMPVRQGGKNFSGGQKQRLTIARALVGKPQVLILDDSSSALDFRTESKLRQALAKLDTTIIMISQRVSSVQHADQILVMNKGRSAGIGTHEELLVSSEIYQAIVASQMQEEKEE
ncbi:ABC transporter ATP-binding protein [Aerococcus sp. HMSC10H05]|uniref:ABC transporter ATP-binding protein n=1 Tax=Aerococcus sp. HMSC10H05 TaxID=1581084 RepID=UPI0008A622A3|nr:ABC transporter ATP-binding protein [Aerococcus sp. HMSC10H05]OFU51523.1 ABC transporter permease [Aerococcus sp. HMSC10H05]